MSRILLRRLACIKAKARVQALGELWPGEYVIHDEATGERISIIVGDTTK